MYNVQLTREITRQQCYVKHITSVFAAILHVFGMHRAQNILLLKVKISLQDQHRSWWSNNDCSLLAASLISVLHRWCHGWIRNDVRPTLWIRHHQNISFCGFKHLLTNKLIWNAKIQLKPNFAALIISIYLFIQLKYGFFIFLSETGKAS